jgi:hypothetical protein
MWSATERSVAELIDNMAQKGLTFAPCAQRDEDAYNAIYRAMVNYSSGMRDYPAGGEPIPRTSGAAECLLPVEDRS